MFSKKRLGAAAAVAGAMFLLPAAGHATTFIQTSDDSSGGQVGFNSANKITVTQEGADLDISVTLATGWGIVSTGAGGTNGAQHAEHESFSFGLAGVSSLTFLADDPTTFKHTSSSNTWHPDGVQPSSAVTSATVSKQTITAPGKFQYTSGYGLVYDSNGGSHPFTGLEFDLKNMTLATFLSDLQSSTKDNSTGHCSAGSSGCFYIDVRNASGKTGLIDFGLAPVPVPAALPLFAGGLGVMGIFGWRKRRKAAAAA